MTRLNRLPMWTLVATWIAIGIALPALYGLFNGVRDTSQVLVHDEHCYLLQADTFARGRLTNPPPRHPEFFESPYIFVEPSYQAKYPPGQAVFLMIGQRFVGHPIWGVWLSCGLFAGSLYWMLSGWTNRKWAMLGTLHAVAILGITHHWAQQYWGGMVAAWGGALVLGGTRWTIRRGTFVDGLLTGLGAVALANSRPYEGSVVCLACAVPLAWWLLKGSAQDCRRKLVRWCVPFALVLAAGGFSMAAYNQAVTGSWKTLPYALHPKQYFTCGMFRWQPTRQVPERRALTRAQQFYEKSPALNPGTVGGPENGVMPVVVSIRNAFLDLFRNFMTGMPKFQGWHSWTAILLFSSLVLFLATSVGFMCTTKRWGLLHAAWCVILLELLAGAAVWWSFPHYRAPIACLCSFLVVDWLRRVTICCRGRLLPHALRTRHVILAFCILIPALLYGSQIAKAVSSGASSRQSPSKAVARERTNPSPFSGLTRGQLIELLSQNEQPALAFVSYERGVSLHQEWVYNSADLESQRVILAHDLGPENDPLLIADFPDRQAWRVHVTASGATVEPYDDAAEPNSLRDEP